MPDTTSGAREEPPVLYVGQVVPDVPEFRSPAFSPPGNLFQLSLLEGLAAAGAPIMQVLSQRPERLFPRGRRIWVRGGVVEVARGLSARLVPYLNVPFVRPLSVGTMVIASIWRTARRVRPATLVVLTYNLSEPPGLFTWLGARLVGAKTVAFMCDVHVPGVLVADSWARRLDFLLQRWLMPRYDGLIVVNEQIARDFAPQVPHIRVEGGVTQPMLAVRPRAEARPDGHFTMVAAGSLHRGNGIEEILEAMKLLPGEYRLRIAGAGVLEGIVREAAAQDPRIDYLGLLRFEDVLRLYSEADVLLNVRLTERVDTRYYFPSKTMEYLASGVPVITTCPGNVRNEFSGLAYLLDDETPAALARTIAAVAALPRPARVEKARAAREFMARERTWDVQGRRIIDFLREGLR